MGLILSIMGGNLLVYIAIKIVLHKIFDSIQDDNDWLDFF